MTITNTARRVAYVGNGYTTIFPVTFQVQDSASLDVYVGGVLKAYGTDYTLDLAAPNTTCNVIMNSAPATNVTVAIVGDTAPVQSTQFRDNSAFPAATVETTLDRMMAVVQETITKIGQAFRVTPDATPVNPVAAPSANTFLYADVNKNLSWVSAGTLGVVPIVNTGATNHYRTFTDFVNAIPSIDTSTVKWVVVDYDTPSAARVEPLVWYFSGSSSGRYLEQSYGGGYWVPQYSTDKVNAVHFGATGDGSTDDTVAIQKAIDFALQNYAPEVVLPAGNYKITDTLHLGYGNSLQQFATVRLVGTKRGKFDTALAGTMITSTMQDRPAINIQGGRHSGVYGISLRGPNYSWINAATGPSAGLSSDQADWLDTTLVRSGANPGGLQRYSPLAAITIDAYSGAAPGAPYPTPTYPAFSGTQTSYNKALSSQTTIEGCDIQGYAVGVMQSPSSPNQGDFLRVRDSQIGYCVYAISIGNSQSRNVEIRNVEYVGVHTFLTTSRHGSQQGRLGGPIVNVNGTTAYQFCDLQDTLYNDPVTVDNLYFENQVRVGVVGSQGTTANVPVIFRGGDWNVSDYQHGYLPTALVVGGVQQSIKFEGVTFSGSYFRPPMLVQGASSVVIDSCVFSEPLTQITGSNGTAATQRLINYTGGVFVDQWPWGGGGRSPSDRGLAQWIGGSLATYQNGPTSGTGYQVLADDVQFYAQGAGGIRARAALTQSATGFKDTQGRRWKFDATPFASANLANGQGYTQAGVTFATTDTITFGWAAAWQKRHDLQLAVGDILYNVPTSTYFLVTVVGALSGGYYPVTAQQMNNMKVNTSTGACTNNYISDNTVAGTTHIIRTNFDLPSQVEYGQFTSGSAAVAVVSRGDGYGGDAATYLASGDRLASPIWNSGGVAGWPIVFTSSGAQAPTISSVTNGSPGSLTMSENAIATGTYPIYPLPIK